MAGNIGSFSFDVTQRLLSILYRDGPTKKTALATKSRLNYNVCLRYIQMLKVLGWLEVSSDVAISETGRLVLKRLMNEGESTGPKNIISPHQPVNSYKKFINNVSNKQTITSSTKAHQLPVHNPNILMVDDEPDVLLTYESFLAYTGFKVRTFTDSLQALKAFASNPGLYDLIILDIRMENLNGLQLYQALKAMNPSSKIIFVSALDAAKELTAIFPDIGSEDVIKKPIDKENFIRTVRAALDA